MHIKNGPVLCRCSLFSQILDFFFSKTALTPRSKSNTLFESTLHKASKKRRTILHFPAWSKLVCYQASRINHLQNKHMKANKAKKDWLRIGMCLRTPFWKKLSAVSSQSLCTPSSFRDTYTSFYEFFFNLPFLITLLGPIRKTALFQTVALSQYICEEFVHKFNQAFLTIKITQCHTLTAWQYVSPKMTINVHALTNILDVVCVVQADIFYDISAEASL